MPFLHANWMIPLSKLLHRVLGQAQLHVIIIIQLSFFSCDAVKPINVIINYFLLNPSRLVSEILLKSKCYLLTDSLWFEIAHLTVSYECFLKKTSIIWSACSCNSTFFLIIIGTKTLKSWAATTGSSSIWKLTSTWKKNRKWMRAQDIVDKNYQKVEKQTKLKIIGRCRNELKNC